MSIATRLDDAMKAARIPSQSALARASGIPQPTINRILKGESKRGPESETVKKLAAACNVTFDWLNEGIGTPSRSSTGNYDPHPPVNSVQERQSDNLYIVRPVPKWMEPDAYKLLDLFYGLDDEERRTAMAFIEDIASVNRRARGVNEG